MLMKDYISASLLTSLNQSSVLNERSENAVMQINEKLHYYVLIKHRLILILQNSVLIKENANAVISYY